MANESLKMLDYSSAEHGFFPELVRLVICLSAVGIGFELQKTGVVRAYDSRTVMTLQGNPRVSGIEIRFLPSPLYERLLSPGSRHPRYLTAIKAPIPDIPPTHPILVTKTQQLMYRLVGDAFLSYYERNIDTINRLFGKESDGMWPPAWEFGWAIRNACAHDGKINFKHSGRAPVQWKSLSYSYESNGRQVLFGDMTAVELILLMEDMDAEMKSTANTNN